MKKFGTLVLVFVCCLLFVIYTVGCGTSGTSATTTTAAAATTTTSTTTTTVAGGISSISGTLSTGSISSAGINASGLKTQAVAFAALPNYTVTAVGKNTGQAYFSAATESDGSFTISDLPSQEAFYLQILNSSNQLAAPVAFGATSGGAAMSIAASSAATAAVDLGAIVYDSTKDSAAPSTAPTDYLDATSTVEAKTGETLVPKGAGNFGKGSGPQFSGTYDSTNVDGDGDGLPNIVDADNDGNGVLDEFDGLATMETLAASTSKIGYSAMWTNLKVPYGQAASDVYNTPTGFWVIIAMHPASGQTISSASLESGPSWVHNAKIHGQNYTWQSVDYALEDTPGDDRFQVTLGGAQIAPGSIIKAGDTLIFHVVFTDGTSEKIAKMINFAIEEVPYVKGYYSGQYSSDSDFLTQGLDDQMHNVFDNTTIDNAVFSLKWQKVTDESGAYVEGATYAWEVGEGNYVTPTVTTETGSAYVYGYANLESEVLATAESFSCCIAITSDLNDNATQNAAYKKTTTWGH